MSLEVSGVNHQGTIKRCLVCQPTEKSEITPPDGPIVQCLARTLFFRGILPLKPVPDGVSDAADDAPVIDTGNTVRTGKKDLIRSSWLSER